MFAIARKRRLRCAQRKMGQVARSPIATGRAGNRAVKPGSFGLSSKRNNVGSQLRPWHKPIPHRVTSFTAFADLPSRTGSICAKATSSHLHTSVSSRKAGKNGRGSAISSSRRAKRSKLRWFARCLDTRRAASSWLIAPSSAAIPNPAIFPLAIAAFAPAIPVVSPAT